MDKIVGDHFGADPWSTEKIVKNIKLIKCKHI
jgi:hypothetical protein